MSCDQSSREKANAWVEKMWDVAFEIGMVNPVISRVSKDLGDTTDEAILGLHSFFRLMALSYMYPGKIAYTKFPDDRGHVFSFNHKKYSEFCDKVFGEMIFHTPDEYCDRALLDSLEKQTIEMYNQHFINT